MDASGTAGGGGGLELLAPGPGPYSALPIHRTAVVFISAGVLGSLLHLFILMSYFFVPTIKAQHPAANLVIWHVGCNLMTALGFAAQFLIQGSAMWYLMLTMDLLVALVNPWMGYTCKAWAYHIITVTAIALLQFQLDGTSALGFCWVARTATPSVVNKVNWVLLFGPIIAFAFVSMAVLVFASFRFVRRQLDVTYRAKRRNLLQYYRYLVLYSGYWACCGGLYYTEYRHDFAGPVAAQLQMGLLLVLSSYPLWLLVVWALNTDLYQDRSGENALTSAERAVDTEHFSAVLRKDLMRYTTAGIRCSIQDAQASPEPTRSPQPPERPPRGRATSIDRAFAASLSLRELEEGESVKLYNEKKRLATTVYNNEYRYYEKLGFTDYAPRVFENIREICGVDNQKYEQSFADTLLERASEGKSGMLFYFSSDRKYIVKTMTKREHSFLLKILPLYHQYLLKQPNTLLCRFLGCHSMQLPRYDLKGIFYEAQVQYQEEAYSREAQSPQHVNRKTSSTGETDQTEPEVVERTGSFSEVHPLLRGGSRSSLCFEDELVTRRTFLHVNSTTRANLLAQVTSDCAFLQELGIMDYSCLLGIRHYSTEISPATLEDLPHNAVVSEDQKTIYYLGFIDILQHYNLGWKLQNFVLSMVLDKRRITAVPPAEYALRFLGFIHEYLLRDDGSSFMRSYGSIDNGRDRPCAVVPGTATML
ncbi:TPA: hypothetical protein N0F65_005454 [Lagenidium giganteum]|uniref:PIPK domain-containing protein n=1 Tax=Lagenidium giganteum TaxID=4803 RepID=A0AAV2YY36_9STRA|nr:TPA: hypothetical protein N0F65_005454 [Lagenidium giganteum]